MKNLSKKISKQFLVIGLALLVLCGYTAFGQTSYSVDPASTMTINGTSTLHDWESEVTKIEGAAQIAMNGSSIASIEKLNINIPVSSIKSGKSSMDKNTYDALKKDSHPEIKFQLKQIKTNQDGQLKASGELTIAGVTRTVEMPVKYSVDPAKVVFKGSYTFNMSDFKIDPPTALMGTVKTGDQVTLNFNTLFIKR